YSCKEDETAAAKVNITFDHKVGMQDLIQDSIVYTNMAGNPYSVMTLKYFISDVVLHKSNGSSVFIDAEHYVDAFDAQTLIFDSDTELSEGDFSHISFVFGMDSAKNIDGRFVNAPESNMEWPEPMGGQDNAGYHYMKLEGKFRDSNNMVMNYNTHTGASMGMPYHVNVTLPNSDFFVNGDAIDITLTMDINNWYQNPTTYDFNEVGMMMMGNQAAQAAIQGNGSDVFTVSISD
ncbi:MAG: hypothetical protein ACI8ZO_001430, partial [Flavobacteriales bacterium]